MSCGIYKITNQINNKIYIGKSINIERRWKEYQYNYCKGKIDTSILRALHKYGIENFSFNIIELCTSELLNNREKYWIKYYNSYDTGYNETLGGDGSSSINPQNIYDEWDKGFAITEIAKKLQYSPSTVYNYLLTYSNYSKEESIRRGKWLRNRNKIKKSNI